MAPDLFSRMRHELDQNADRLLLQQRPVLKNPDPVGMRVREWEEKVRKRLLKQRHHLFTFLDHDEVDATNNLAERQLRPAVITRKISCGNKTEKGSKSWQILASLSATCQQKRTSFIDLVHNAIIYNQNSNQPLR